MIASALASSCRCCSISTADSSSAVGLAMFLPAMSGARAVHGLEHAAPLQPDVGGAGTTPSPPTSPAHRSDTMSP